MQLILRSTWRAREPVRRHLIDVPTPKLYLHHAAGAILPGDDSVSEADLRRIRSIQNYHMDTRGWSDIAYSFLTDPDGHVFEGRGAGVAGGHTAGQNTVSHAICVMGNYDTQEVDSDLVPRLVEIVRYGHEQGWWPLGFTGGHRDAPGAATSCPGRNLYPLIPVINAKLLSDQEDDDMATPEEIAKAVWLHTDIPDPEKPGQRTHMSDAIKRTWAAARQGANQTTREKLIEAAKYAAAGVAGGSAVAIVDEIARRLGGG